jgi:adenosine/AMP kinase
MNLYVWADFEPDYTPGLAFALAETEAEARRLVQAKCDEGLVRNWGEVQVHPVAKIAFVVYGGG